jgi:serine/threonine protein kinase/predicted ATPase
VQDTPHSERPGDSIGRYVLTSHLGQGGNAEVFRADLRGPHGFRKSVALKLIRELPDRKMHANRMVDFIREARLGGLLRHPNIVDVYEFGAADGRHFIAMELVEGWSLRDLVKETGALPISVILQLAEQTCSALDAAHGLKLQGADMPVIHRDLKPANIMLNRYGIVKVVDFGIARLQGGDVGMKRAQGTVAYMAPEQLTNTGVDARSDLFALSATLYELVTGKRLFRGSLATLMVERMHVDALLRSQEIWEPVDKRCPDLTPLLQRCLRANPNQRLSSAREFRMEIQDIASRQNLSPTLIDWIACREQPAPDADPEVTASADLTADPVSLHSDSDAPATNIAPPTSPFFGRKDLIDKTLDALNSHRVVTLAGLGGMGKTRLAIEAGLQAVNTRSCALWFCDLAEARNGDRVLHALASTLGLRLQGPSEDAHVAQIGRALVGRQEAVFLFDNAELVTEPLGALVKTWIKQAPEATFLITSRTPIGIAPEYVVSVGSLSIQQSEALFRSRSIRPIGPDEPGIAELMSQLDGMPLAIELAARRTDLFTPEQLLNRLHQRFRLLRNVTSTGNVRHDTLRAVLTGTWSSLNAWEQDTLAQVSVFRGGFQLEDAEEVVDLSAHADAPWVVDAIQSLLDKQLLTSQHTSDGIRLGLLISVAQYASDRLATAGDGRLKAAERRHAERYARLGSVPFQDLLNRHEGPQRMASMHRELDNLLAASERALTNRWAPLAPWLARGAFSILLYRGPLTKGIDALRASLGLELLPRDRGYVQASICIGRTAQGKYDEARKAAERALELAQRHDIQNLECLALVGLGRLKSGGQRPAESIEIYTRALTLAQEIPNPIQASFILANLGNTYFRKGELETSRRYLRRARRGHHDIGNVRGEALTMDSLGHVEESAGELKTSFRYFESAVAMHRRIGNRAGEASSAANMGLLLHQLNRPKEAEERYQHSLRIAKDMGMNFLEALCQGNLGDLHAGWPQDLLAGQHPNSHIDLEQARTHFEAAIHLAKSRNYKVLAHIFATSLALLMIVQGEGAEAGAMLRDAEKIVRDSGLTAELTKLLCKRGEAAFRIGDPTTASAYLEEATELTRIHDFSPKSTSGRWVQRLSLLLERS